MDARGAAHDRIRHLLDDEPAPAAPDERCGPSLRWAAIGAAVCLALLVVVLVF
ncbi:hypothetical protein [Dietzia sp. 179-F 9C3 NHS]|uniref:hypothetical protein n=1 Tax=Dietzia sp. 179-F 9C3 NHS TaxID=3374295 RepID=UPI003879777C